MNDDAIEVQDPPSLQNFDLYGNQDDDGMFNPPDQKEAGNNLNSSQFGFDGGNNLENDFGEDGDLAIFGDNAPP